MIIVGYFHENISSLDFTMFTMWSSQCACNMLHKILYDPGTQEKVLKVGMFRFGFLHQKYKYQEKC